MNSAEPRRQTQRKPAALCQCFPHLPTCRAERCCLPAPELARGGRRLDRRIAAPASRGGAWSACARRRSRWRARGHPHEEPQPRVERLLRHQVDAQRGADGAQIHTPGTRNPRSSSGRVRRSTITPMLTMKNANSVPMLTSSAIVVERDERGEDRDQDAEEHVGRRASGGARRGSPALGHQPVARHREHDPRLAVEHGQHDRGDGDQRAERDQVAPHNMPAPSSSTAASGASAP